MAVLYSSVFELLRYAFQVLAKLVLDLVNFLVGGIKFSVDSTLRFRDLSTVCTSLYILPYDQFVEFCYCLFDVFRHKAAFIFPGLFIDSLWREQYFEALGPQLTLFVEPTEAEQRVSNATEYLEHSAELLHFDQGHVLEVDGFHFVLDRVRE